MKKIFLLLMMVASTTLAKPAKSVDEWTFFSGAHLGMTMTEYVSYYDPISDTRMNHSGAPKGQQIVEFRSYGTDEHDWRVMVTYRESDGVIVSIDYWNESGKFSKEMINLLEGLNKGYPGLIHTLYNDGADTELYATTAAQEKLESVK
jgi:hypothetical protein